MLTNTCSSTAGRLARYPAAPHVLKDRGVHALTREIGALQRGQVIISGITSANSVLPQLDHCPDVSATLTTPHHPGS